MDSELFTNPSWFSMSERQRKIFTPAERCYHPEDERDDWETEQKHIRNDKNESQITDR